MTRLPRTISSTGFYHLMARGVGRCIIFEDDADREMLLGLLRDNAKDAAVEIYAWCLMDNHYHLLVHGDMGDISTMMLRSDSRYAQHFNARHGRVGHLFQDRFASEPVETEEYLLLVVRYIHLNPLKAGLSTSCDYPWSSYGSLRDDSWPDPVQPAAQLFASREDFVRFHEHVTPCPGCIDVGRLRGSVSGEEVLEVAKHVLGEMRVEEVAGLPRPRRDDALRRLKGAGLTLRQIERLTGVSKSVVGKA